MVAKLLRYRLSKRPSGEFSDTICRIDVDFFWTVRPCACTEAGSEASAVLTRFCTSTCAKSRSVPIWNVTVSV